MGLDLSHHPWIIGPQTMWDKIWINTFLFNIFFLINELWIGILKAKDVTIYRHVIETWNAPIGFHIMHLIRGRTCQQNTRIQHENKKNILFLSIMVLGLLVLSQQFSLSAASILMLDGHARKRYVGLIGQTPPMTKL